MQIQNWAKFTTCTKILWLQRCMLHRHTARDQGILQFNNLAKTMPITHSYLSRLLLRTPVEVTQCFLSIMGRTSEVILGKSSNQVQSMTKQGKKS